MNYFACAYFDQTYFSTDCAPTGGRGTRGMARVIRPAGPDEYEEDLLWIT